MFLKMTEEEFKELLESMDKYKLSCVTTDDGAERIKLLGHTYSYELDRPSLQVYAEREDPLKLLKMIKKKINTTVIQEMPLISIIENIYNINLEELREDYG